MVCDFWQEADPKADKVMSNSCTPKLIHGTCQISIVGMLMQEAPQAVVSNHYDAGLPSGEPAMNGVTPQTLPQTPTIGNYLFSSVDVPVQEAHQAADIKTDDADLPEGGPAGE